MAYSQVVIPSDGSTTLLVVNFALGYINKSYITVWAEGEYDGSGNQVYRGFTFINDTQMQVSGSAPPIGKNWVISRTVPKSQLIVDWADGDAITGDNLDTAQLQAIHMTHEALDLANRGIKAPVGSVGPTLTRGQTGDALIWDANGNIIAGTGPEAIEARITELASRLATLAPGVIQQGRVTPLQFGAVGDGIHDDTAAIKAMVASDAMVVDWLGTDYTWLIKDTIDVVKPNITWLGGSMIRMDRRALWCKPMVVVHENAENFWGSDMLRYDHMGGETPAATRNGDLALALGTAFIVMSNNSHAGGKFYNAFDVGLGFGQFFWTGDGSVAAPYNVYQQNNGHPYGNTSSYIYGYNCGIGEHTSSTGGTNWNQGAAVDVLTASSANITLVVADSCFCGAVVDFNSQANAAFGTIVTQGTKQDSRLTGGSGMGIYCGDFMTVGSFYSNNDVIGLVCYNTHFHFTVGAAFIWASGEAGVVVAGGLGSISGHFTIGAPGRTNPSSAAFQVSSANTEEIILDVSVNVWHPLASPITRQFDYYCNCGVGGVVRGTVRIQTDGRTTVPFATTGQEIVEYTNKIGNRTFYSDHAGKQSFGGLVNDASNAIIQIPAGQGIDMSSVAPQSINWNVYWDGTNFRRTNGQQGYSIVFNPSTGLYEEDYFPAGTAGGVVASQMTVQRGPNGRFSIFNLVNAANDAAAASAGVPVFGLYRNGSVMMTRVS